MKLFCCRIYQIFFDFHVEKQILQQNPGTCRNDGPLSYFLLISQLWLQLSVSFHGYCKVNLVFAFYQTNKKLAL
jgi:hypothetical protein